jgi:hypothetical protein
MHGQGGFWSELELHDFLSKFADLRFEQIIRHWLALRQEAAIPHRGAVDPIRFQDSLDMVWLMERHDDGHYRYRLAGQAIADIHGGIRRGTDTASLFSPQAVDMFRPRWEAVLDRGQLVRAEGVVVLAGADEIARVERLMLPLRSDDGSVSVILGATSYERPRGPGLTTTDFPPTNIQYCPLDVIPLGACP